MASRKGGWYIVAVAGALLVAAAAYALPLPDRTAAAGRRQEECPDPVEKDRDGRWSVGGVPVPREILPYRDDLCRVVDLAVVATVMSVRTALMKQGAFTLPRSTARLFVEAVAHGDGYGPWLDLPYIGGEKNGRRIGSIWLKEGQRYLMLLRRTTPQQVRLVAYHTFVGVVALDPLARLPSPNDVANYWEVACRLPLDVPQRTLEASR